MKSKQPSNGTIFGGLILLVLSSATLVQGQAVLVDFGNASSFRGATQTGADANGNYWTSIYSGAYYSNLADLSSSATTWGIGFNASTGLKREARQAGRKPEIRPVASDTPSAIATITIDMLVARNRLMSRLRG